MLKKFALLLLTSVGLFAQHYGPIEILKAGGKNSLPSSSRKGVSPYKYTITNSDNKPHHVKIERSYNAYYGNYIASVKKAVTVPANSRINFQFNLPATQNSYNNSFDVIIDGERQENSLQCKSVNSYYHESVILVERSLKFGGGSIQFQTLEQSLDLLGADLGPYFLFDAIYLTGKKFKELPQVTQTGLLDYARCGGKLYIHGELPIPGLKSRLSYKWGKGFRYGFGDIFSVDVVAGKHDSDLSSNFASLRNGSRRFSYDDSVDYIFSDIDQVSHGLLATFVLFFIIIAGPVLLFRLNKKNKIIHYLWAAPALSVIFAVGLLLFGGIIDGFTPLEVKQTSTFLDQVNNRSYTRSLLGIYSPISYGQGLRLDKSVVFESPQHYRHTRATIDSTTDWWLKGDTIKAKVPFMLSLTEAKTCRKRIQFYQSGDKMKVINGLGETVDFLCFSHDNKVYLHKEPIKAGATIELSGSNIKTSRRRVTPSSTFSYTRSQAEQIIDDLDTNKCLENNSYIAISTGSNPFIKPTIEKADQVSEAIIYGIFEVKK